MNYKELKYIVATAFLLSLFVCEKIFASQPIVYPEDSKIVDVRDYGAIPNDGKDDTAAIQEEVSFPLADIIRAKAQSE
jgi:hypothetical protein